MDMRKTVLNLGLRALRLAGGLLLIYASMVFYLALTERQNAYPRAITHNEAQAAIQKVSSPLTCTLEDGITLEGWSIGNAQDPSLLYYPDADEDAAQFLAEVQGIEGYNLVAFNYRGSANNKGTPSADNFEPDARQIAECAKQINGKKAAFLVGRGTGAILAAQQLGDGQKLILIDPVMSIADAISEKYRLLYPRFLIRAKEKIPENELKKRSGDVILLKDRKNSCEDNHKTKLSFLLTKVHKRGQNTLQKSVSEILHQASNPIKSRN
jgi:hypothetical protein